MHQKVVKKKYNHDIEKEGNTNILYFDNIKGVRNNNKNAYIINTKQENIYM